MRFGEPSALFLLLLFPLGAALVLLAARRGRTALRRFGIRAPALVEGDSRTRRRVRDLLLLGAVLLLATAAARPQWGRQEQEVTLVGVDIVLAMDTSFSMDARDVAPSRMERALYIAGELLDRMVGNRVGIVAFSGTAFTQCPLTHDLGAVRTLLSGIATGAVESPGTNLAGMIGEAARAFERQESRHRVVVLLTDGQQDDLRVAEIVEVARTANEHGIVVLPVGVGTPGGATIPADSDSGPTLMRDAAGSPIVSRLDRAALSELAALTGGVFFEVSADDREIEGLTARIAGIEGGELGARISRRYREQFWIPAALAAGAITAAGFAGPSRRRRSPVRRGGVS